MHFFTHAEAEQEAALILQALAAKWDGRGNTIILDFERFKITSQVPVDSQDTFLFTMVRFWTDGEEEETLAQPMNEKMQPIALTEEDKNKVTRIKPIWLYYDVHVILRGPEIAGGQLFLATETRAGYTLEEVEKEVAAIKSRF